MAAECERLNEIDLHGGKKNEAVLLASNLSTREYSTETEEGKKNI